MEQFKCPICKNQYTQTNPPRILTMCGHSFCHSCIKNLIKKKDYKYVVRCPDDRSKINVDTNAASYFPKNIALLEALRRHNNKNKPQNSESHNEFLIGEQGKETVRKHQAKSSDFSFKSFLSSRRGSIEEGICLLHRKPLDIICLQEKIHICAECALFGLHKGHNFTTIKELLQKNQQWGNNIKEIIQQKKHIDTKILNGQIQHEVLQILKKKKDLLGEQIDTYINRVKQKFYQIERQIRDELQRQMQKLQVQLKKVLAIHPEIEKNFKQWIEKVELKTYKIQKENQQQLEIIILEEQDQRLQVQGQQILQNIKNQLSNFWSKIQNVLEYPKIQYSSSIQKQLSNLIQFQTSQSSIKKQGVIETAKMQDQTLIEQRKSDPISDEVSLLDISGRYQHVQNQQRFTVNFSRISLINDSFEFNTNENLQQSQICLKKTLTKVKSDKSLISSISYKPKYRSPKERLKTQMFSKKNIYSNVPASPKSKLKRFILKTKQPEKFQKIVSALETDSINSIDFTGFEMGDEVAKQICIKILDCKRPKLLRLMKNGLTDESCKEVVQCLKVIDYLNLAQNNFTQKILDMMIDLSKKGEIGKNKTIQLGQNHLNSRKYKSKIDQLKKLGVIITL